MGKLLKVRGFLGVFVVSILASIFCLSNTYATVKSSDSLYKLSILQGVRGCYNDYATDEITDLEFSSNGGWKSIFSENKNFSDNENGAWVTTHVGNNLNAGFEKDSNLSCSEVFEGYRGLGGSAKGLQDYYTLPDSLTGMGYEKTGEDTSLNGGMLTFTLLRIEDKTGNRSEIRPESGKEKIECALVDAFDKSGSSGGRLNKIGQKIGGCIGEILIKNNGEGESSAFHLKFNGGTKPEIENIPRSSSVGTPVSSVVGPWVEAVFGSTRGELTTSLKENVIDNINESLGLKFFTEQNMNGTSVVTIKHAVPYWDYGWGDKSLSAVYRPTGGNKVRAAGIMLNGLGVDSGLAHFDPSEGSGVTYIWNDDWKYSLYYLYLMDMIKRNPNDIKIESCGEDKPSTNWAFKNSPSMWCAISVSDAFAKKLDSGELVVSVPKGTFSMGKGDFKKDVLIWLKDENSYANMSDDAYAEAKVNDDGTISSYAQEGVDYSDECYNNSGSLSWIICPIVEGASGIGGYMWERVENYHLKIPAQEVFESGGGVEQAWKIVRDIANIVFIILLLFVIFSQLTGVGIDNYGIKKIMPKLILVAVLVNLSYIICQLAVDLSNILGVGLNSLLSGFAESGFTNLNTGGTGSTVAGWSMTGLLGGGGLALYGVLAGGTTLPLAGAAIGLMVLGVVITVVVALLTLYLILIIREAGIILAIVVAPVAIVCYMLPNTEKLYKKWFNIFKALLLVYPICGALVGAGQLAGVTLASIDSGSMRVAAMIVQVLPFFFIPMLLKSSMALMGNLGAKISTFGRSLGSRGSSIAKSTIRNTEGFKEMSQFGKDASILRRAQRIHNRYSGRKNLSEREALRLGKADAALLGREEAVNRGKLMADGGYTARVIAQEKEVDAKAIEDAMVKIKADTNDGADEKAVQTVFNDAMSRGDRITARAALRVAGRRKDTAAAFMQETLMNGDKTYDKTMLASVAKEISEGQTSANYRAASSLGFEFASQLNKGDTDLSYKDWIADQKNIHNALDHHIATSGQLMGSQNSSLEEIADLASTGGMGEYDVDRVRSLAQEAIRFNKEKGVEFDTTKAFNAYRLAYGDEAFLSRMREDGVQIDPKKLEEFRAKRQSGALPNRPFKVRPTRQ